ncbi:MAG TPA: hypothetical protein VMU81_16755 [Acetobacteraceae bacterium]|nr:hypothetical protein [Acetobacteraceae bacterium]
MWKIYPIAVTIMILSVGTAIAKPAPVGPSMQIASSRTGLQGFDEIRTSHQPGNGDHAYPRITAGARGTQPTDWDQEPEAINLGTEP